ncbi:MAG: ABC transporter permease [Candidatus Sulfotelmatobacter sp.]|jgi:NitT/TauT family transport system permease protein
MNSLAQPMKWEKYFWPIFAALLFLGLWHFSVKWSATKVFPSPLDVERGTAELVSKGLLARYVSDSLQRVAWGYLTAAGLGIPLGLLLGWYPEAAAVVNPTIQMLRPISPIAWIPVSIVWFGVGNLAAIYLIFLASFFPIVVASMNAVRNVPSMYRRAGRNFGLSPAKLIAMVVFPASLPQIIVGLRIALGIAWLVVVAAEMTAIDSGLGYLIIDSRNSGKRYDLVVAAMILIGLTGLALDTIFRRVEKLKSVRWGFRHEF